MQSEIYERRSCEIREKREELRRIRDEIKEHGREMEDSFIVRLKEIDDRLRIMLGEREQKKPLKSIRGITVSECPAGMITIINIEYGPIDFEVYGEPQVIFNYSFKNKLDKEIDRVYSIVRGATYNDHLEFRFDNGNEFQNDVVIDWAVHSLKK